MPRAASFPPVRTLVQLPGVKRPLRPFRAQFYVRKVLAPFTDICRIGLGQLRTSIGRHIPGGLR